MPPALPLERIVQVVNAGSARTPTTVDDPCLILVCNATDSTVDPLQEEGRQEVMSMKSVNAQPRLPLAHLRSPETRLHGSNFDIKWVLDKILERPDARELVNELNARLMRLPIETSQQRYLTRTPGRAVRLASTHRRAS